MMNEWKDFLGRHREGVLGTVIFHLLLLIMLVSAGISRERSRRVMEVELDLPTAEEVERARVEREWQEEVERQATEGEVERMLRSLAVNEEEVHEGETRGDVRERVEEYIRELERELEEGRQARRGERGGEGVVSGGGEREADSLAYERTRRERELDSLRSTVYAGRSSVTYRLEGRHKVVLPIPVFRCEFGGRVVVAVTVDREGRVKRAEVVERESKVDDCLRTAALEAARESVFSAKEDAPEWQEGTITYNFVRQ